ncbi:MAG: Flagellin N-methylase [Methanocella sp. PtaU1.Bin125]|nr:MAG: Flagellin N-methylase [Methanocella sp. PtaU1.Bin125]
MIEMTLNQFQCKQCGSCCKSDSMIPLTLDDIFRIADFLDLGPDEFMSRYCTEVSHGNSVPMPYLKRENGCPFLDDGLCSIHFVKPLLCKYMPSTMFGSLQYLRSKMPPSCAIHHMKSRVQVNDDDRIREKYMVSMILTSIYYSIHSTFIYEQAKPYIYRILLINRNRNSLFRDQSMVTT